MCLCVVFFFFLDAWVDVCVVSVRQSKVVFGVRFIPHSFGMVLWFGSLSPWVYSVGKRWKRSQILSI